MDHRAQGGWFILVTVLIALLLSIYPLPLWARWFRPDWLLLVLCYWMIVAPHRVGVGWAWVAGLLLDILEATTLGQNAFALAVVAYITQASYQRLRMFSHRKQAFVIFFLVALHLLLYQWVQNLLGIAEISVMLGLQALLSALFWPIVRVVLDRFQHVFRVV